MVGIFQNEFDWTISPETTNTKVKPIFGVTVHTDISIALNLDGEGCSDCDICSSYVSSWEAAINDDIVVESKVIAIRVPLGLFLFVLKRFTHLYTIKIIKSRAWLGRVTDIINL